MKRGKVFGGKSEYLGEWLLTATVCTVIIIIAILICVVCTGLPDSTACGGTLRQCHGSKVASRSQVSGRRPRPGQFNSMVCKTLCYRSTILLQSDGFFFIVLLFLYLILSVSCHLTQVSAPHLNPSQAIRYSVYLPQRDGRLTSPWWLVIDWDGLPVGRLILSVPYICSETIACVTHPCTSHLIATQLGVELMTFWS